MEETYAARVPVYAFVNQKGGCGKTTTAVHLAGALAARGERDVEYARGYFSVFVKELIKIAHAIKQEAVGVLCLDAEILLHHWGVGA